MRDIAWIILYPYFVITGFVVLFLCLNYNPDIYIANEVISIIIITIGIILSLILIFIIPRIVNKKAKKLLNETNNSHMLIKYCGTIKTIQIPAHILCLFCALICFNPFLIVLSGYLIAVIFICIKRSSKFAIKAMNINNNSFNKWVYNVLNMLLFFPILDIICASIISHKLKHITIE